MRTTLAWIYVVVVLTIVAATVSAKRRGSRRARTVGQGVEPQPQSADDEQVADSRERRTREKRASVYDETEPSAHRVKALLQMAIGVAAICVVGWQFLHGWPASKEDSTSLLLNGIGVALAAAAVVELAYTLFTEGPDEALDPLMLGLAATLLIQLGKLDQVSVSAAAGLLLLGILLAVLFVTRLFLAEHDDERGPSHLVGRPPTSRATCVPERMRAPLIDGTAA